MFSLIKEINKSVKHLIYFYEKLMFSKLQFNWEENLKKCATFDEQKGTRFAEMFILALSSSAVFRLENLVSDLF